MEKRLRKARRRRNQNGRFWVAHAVTQVGDLYHYEYAIFNLTSDRSGGSFTIDVNITARRKR